MLAAWAGGWVWTLWLLPDWPRAARAAAALVLGIALQAHAGLLGAWWGGLEHVALPAALAASLLPLAALGHFRVRERAVAACSRAEGSRPTRRQRTLAWLGYAAAALALVAALERAVLDSPAGLATGSDHNIGDLPFHLAVTAAFAHGGNFPPEHPELAGARLCYPYLLDFAAALWVKAGVPVTDAFRWQGRLLAPALLLLLAHFAHRLTGRAAAAWLLPALVLLNGGLGFVHLLSSWWHGGESLGALLLALPRNYTIEPEGPLRWGNAVTTLLVTQRTWLLGLPLALLVWTSWWRALDERRAAPWWRAGAILGLIPLAHAHSFAATAAVGAVLALRFPPLGRWLFCAAAALPAAWPQMLALVGPASSLERAQFFGWQLGWDRGALDPLSFWLFNAGPFPLVLLAAWLGRPWDLPTPRLRRFLAPFALLWLAANLLRLSPWIWDNVKLLFPAFVALCLPVALFVERLARAGRAGAVGAALLLLVLTGSGALDVWRLASRQQEYLLYDSQALAFARALSAATPPQARIVHWPTHTAPSLLAGRRSVIGFPGHIWSQGMDSGERERDVQRIYAGGPEAEELLQRYGATFLVWGPLEQQELPPGRRWLLRWPVHLKSGPYVLFDVRTPRPWPPPRPLLPLEE